MKKHNPKIWTFSVPYQDGWYLVDGFEFSIERRTSADGVVWKQKFKLYEDLLNYINLNFPQMMPASRS